MAFFLDEIDGCLWDYLRQTDKKVVLYGMGDGAEKIKSVLDSIDVPVADIMASDEFVRGHSFLGYRVKKLSEVEELYGEDFLILVCFGSQLPDVMEHIYSIAEKHELYAPNVPVVGDGLFTPDYAREHRRELESVYSMLADEQSRLVFENVIRYKLSGRLEFLRQCESPEEEMYDLLKIGAEETYVDLGAYNGDTIVKFLNETGMHFRKIYAMEPDHRNYVKLKRRLYMIGSGLLADLISLQCREISVNLESRRKTTVHVVEFHVVVRTETIVGSSACCTQSRVVLVVDRVALETTGELALPHANLRRNGKRRQECKRQAKQFFQHIGIFFRFKE